MKERNFDQVCEKLVMSIEMVESVWNFYRDARSRKPIFHFAATLMFFFSLATLGNRINNFFLAYLLTLIIFLLPGLHKKGILQQCTAQATLKITELIKGKDHMKKVE